MLNLKWPEFIKFYRMKRKLTSKKLAMMAGIDPSYITLIERKGKIPSYDKVISLARALNISSEQLLFIAGYSPSRLTIDFILNSNGIKAKSKNITPELSECLCDIVCLTESKQRQVANFIRYYLQTVKKRERR